MFEKIKDDNKPSEGSFSKCISYENDREYMFKRSEKRAWLITGVTIFLLIISWVILAIILPLKEVTPYVIQVNEKTGIPDVITVVDPEQLHANEALDKYFVNSYIQTRESYTYQTIQNTYIETQLYSSENVKNEYLAQMNRTDSPDQVMKTGTISVKVNSIILEDINNVDIKMATARIVKTYTTEKNEVYQRNFIIKLSYEYEPAQKLKLSYRLENPLGFSVTSYQIIEENI
ncbi:virB8 family protein [Gilliamella sp. BG6]|uniref:virB8 family protein n=1 Tax=unclassified Gilliamella TaxID=2685620 RepID=UPI0039871C56